jgi:hypothetical protein
MALLIDDENVVDTVKRILNIVESKNKSDADREDRIGSRTYRDLLNGH